MASVQLGWNRSAVPLGKQNHRKMGEAFFVYNDSTAIEMANLRHELGLETVNFGR